MNDNSRETIRIMYLALLGMINMIESGGFYARNVLEQHGTTEQVRNHVAMVSVLYWLRNEIQDELLPAMET